MKTRRHILAVTATLVPTFIAAPSCLARSSISGKKGFAEAMQALETAHGGEICAAVYDYNRRRWHSYRGDQRVAMCSTHKMITVAALLARVDAGAEQLDRKVPIRQEEILSYAPVTKLRVGGEMSLAEICEASLTLSDNTAANLLFNAVGGPDKVTEFVRSVGDRTTNLNRIEPELNEVPAGDVRDTTTPVAIAGLLRKFSLGQVLSPQSRMKLNQWLVANKTGDRRLRGGVPQGWTVGDKTGSNGKKTNDVAVFWPPNRLPMVVTAFYDNGRGETADARGSVLMDVGRAATALLA